MTRTVVQVLGPSTGGMRRHVDFLADALGSVGWRAVIAGPAETVAALRRPDRRIEVIDVGARHALAAAHRIGALAGEVGADVVHAHGLTAGWCAVLARPRPPVVVTAHNVVLPVTKGRLAVAWRPLERLLASRVDAVITTSDAVAARLRTRRRRPVVVAPVAAPPRPGRTPTEVRAALGLAPTAALVAGIGRLHPQKDWPTLVAAARIIGFGREVAVVIAGEGPEEDRLARLVADTAAPVMLVGATDDAAGLLAAADVVVVTSRWESGPLVATEALALGRPLVSTPVGLVPSVVEDGRSGVLVPIGDAGALAAALARLLDDPDAARRLGEEGRRRVAALVDPERLVAAIVAVYCGMLGGR